MVFFKEELSKIKGFVFDVDGVISHNVLSLSPDGDPVRTSNMKDGYAIMYAIRLGYPIGIITGGRTQDTRGRLERLGINYVYMGTLDKVPCLNDFLSKSGLTAEQVLYMGDDIPDYNVMTKVGLAVCPNDAASEIKEISAYISDKNGGEGCVRDVIEQVLRSQGKWSHPEEINWSSF
ncbi:MAG: HAD hydrolase family protein [Prolixibacteraceae bacterium]|jgi:3-deoxy-D-manno-octulosonate 8-phosphate phosphatase (KDO 8-P phosphatase)|nr:HAD hydrolase family protein [Prolixibacteraceae bacterium]